METVKVGMKPFWYELFGIIVFLYDSDISLNMLFIHSYKMFGYVSF